MKYLECGSMRILTEAEIACVAGSVQEESVYYDMGKAFGEAYAYARLKTADFYEWAFGL